MMSVWNIQANWKFWYKKEKDGKYDLTPSVKPKSNQIISFDCLNCTSERYLKDIKQIKLENSNQIMITVMKI